MTTMAEEIRSKRAFHEDIFAEDPEKWSWPAARSNSKASGSGVSYDTHTSEVKSDSSCSNGSENGFVFRGDSNSLKKSFRKRGSSSASDGNNQEDISSSPRPAGGISHERLLPSIYDDDAQSGSPSGIFEKKDLAFRSSFKRSLISSSRDKSRDNSPFHSVVIESEKSEASDREHLIDERNSTNSRNLTSSPKRRDSSDTRTKKFPIDKRLKTSRSRSRSLDKKFRRRSRSHSRSRDKRTKCSRGDRPRSRSKDRRSERDRRRHSKNHRSRSKDSRRRSRSRSYDKHHRRNRYRSSSRDRYRRRRYSGSRSHSRDRSKGGTGGRKPGSLPLSTSAGVMTPQMALQQTMAAMSAKAQALTGIALPKYYNPAAVNPLKYAEQVQKRKLLWQTKEKVEEQPKNSVWDKLKFAQDQDGKMTAKFRKLMGIKSEEGSAAEAEEKESVLKKQEELFRDLDQQYEMARMTTHTQRGVGLGYSIQTLYPPVQK